MCIVIYLALIGLAFLFTGYTLDQYALSVAAGDGGWMQVAMGWEMVSHLWPLALAGALLGSGLTLFVVRRIGAGKK